jgi:hypothetical protein
MFMTSLLVALCLTVALLVEGRMKTLVRDRDGGTQVWWSWQDLRRIKRGGFCSEGRTWLHTETNCYQVAWHFFTRRPSLTLGFSSGASSDEAICLNIGIPFLGSFYFLVQRADWVKKLPGIGSDWNNGEREIGFTWSDDYLFLYLWSDPDHTKLWSPAHFFLGRPKYSQVELEAGAVDVVLPDRTYPATYQLFESIWKRPRWPWSKRILRGEIEVAGGIPVPGKGENSWDLDDTTIDSMTCPATTKEELAQAFATAVLRKRAKYGWVYGTEAAWEQAATHVLDEYEGAWKRLADL